MMENVFKVLLSNVKQDILIVFHTMEILMPEIEDRNITKLLQQYSGDINLIVGVANTAWHPALHYYACDCHDIFAKLRASSLKF